MTMRLLRKVRRSTQLRTRLYWRSRWATLPYESQAPAIIVGGSVRSGTTLMRTILDSHPNIAGGQESWLFVYRPNYERLAAEYDISLDALHDIRHRSTCLAHFIDLFFADYAERMGKPRWAEKSPGNVSSLEYIWRHFPQAKVIHMIRDGRDVVCSIDSQCDRLEDEGIIDGPNLDFPQRMAMWREYVRAGLQWRGDPRYLEVRYENLVGDPETTIRGVLEFVDEPWSDDVLRAHELQSQRKKKIVEYGTPEVHQPIFRDSIERWRRDLTTEQMNEAWRIAGDVLETLGYAP
jgi:hypothetical protein